MIRASHCARNCWEKTSLKTTASLLLPVFGAAVVYVCQMAYAEPQSTLWFPKIHPALLIARFGRHLVVGECSRWRFHLRIWSLVDFAGLSLHTNEDEFSGTTGSLGA